jgi:FtsH-binding integral membrane protein
MVNSSIYNRFFTQKGGERLLQSRKFINIFAEKRELLVSTFANLIVQLGITYYVMEKTIIDPKDKLLRTKMLLLNFSQIAIILILAFYPMPSIFKFLIFCVFSYSFGYMLANIKNESNENTIKLALTGTISIFAIMFSIGTALILSGINLSLKVGLILFYLLFGVILVRLLTLFTGQTSNLMKFLSVFSLFLFSGYIIYDTNKILQREYYGDFITASMDYYLDLLNVFINFVVSLDEN